MISIGDIVRVTRGEEVVEGVAIFVKPQNIFVSYPKLGSEWVPVEFITLVESDKTQWLELRELCRNLALQTHSLLHQGELESVFAIHDWLKKYDGSWWGANQ